jgi:hypothetical protein
MNGASPAITTTSTTASVFDATVTTGNLFGAATFVTIGATTGTLNLRNVTITADNATEFKMNGASPSITTTSTATASVFNTGATTGNLFGAATTATLGYASTDTSTINVSTGAVADSKTKTINIGTGGVVNSITNITIGSTFGTTTTLNGHLIVEGVTSTGATGTNKFVFDTSPTLVTPTLGVATATSINGLTISSSTGTLTIANSKILTASNTLTFTGTDTSSVDFGAGGTVTYTRNKLSVFSATTSAELAGVISDETGSGVLVFGTSPEISPQKLSKNYL